MKPYGLIKRIWNGCKTHKVVGKPIKVTVAPPKNPKAERANKDFKKDI